MRSVQRVSSRQELIAGWNQSKMSSAVGVLIGAGMIGGEIGEGLVRRGIGTLHIFDGDIVEPTNLNRQKFTKRDLYKNKALCLSRILSRSGFLGSEEIAHDRHF